MVALAFLFELTWSKTNRVVLCAANPMWRQEWVFKGVSFALSIQLCHFRRLPMRSLSLALMKWTLCTSLTTEERNSSTSIGTRILLHRQSICHSIWMTTSRSSTQLLPLSQMTTNLRAKVFLKYKIFSCYFLFQDGFLQCSRSGKPCRDKCFDAKAFCIGVSSYKLVIHPC